MPTVILNPAVPPNTGESPGNGATRIRNLTQALLDLFGLPANIAITAPITINRLGPLTNRTGGALVAGDVVGLDATNDSSVVLADTQGVSRPLLVSLDSIANSATGYFGQGGITTVHVFGPVVRGNYLRKATATLALEDGGFSSAPQAGVVGVALTAAAGVGAGTVTALLFGSPGEPDVLDVAAFGVSPGTTASANRTALQAAIDAVPASGGAIRFREYGVHIDAAVNVTKPLKIIGPGTTEVTTPGTFVLYLDTASQVGFNVTGKSPFILQDISVHGAANTIHVVLDGPTGALKGTESCRFDNVVFHAGAIHVDIRNAIFYEITRCLFWNFTGFGVKVHNSLDVDQGDGTIMACTFSGIAGSNGVYWTAGGGLRIVDNKIFACDNGIQIDVQNTAGPNSDILILGNSIENFLSAGILVTRSTGTGVLKSLHVVNNQFGSFGNTASAVIVSPLAGGTLLQYGVASGNEFAFISGSAFVLREVNVATIFGNVIDVTTAAFNVDSTVVNTRIGLNEYGSTPTIVLGTSGASTTMQGGVLSVAKLPAGIGNASQVYASDALGPGDGGYTGYGMTATAGGSGAPAFKQGGTWKV